jgi:4-diphosphocytidyl-2-C-methyl-D-erythritol kinase
VTVLRCLAPGKLNACLFVGAPRDDGLHPLVSVIQPLSLADEVTLSLAPPGVARDEVVCPGVEGPNLAERALAAFRHATGWVAPPQRLSIVKHVPVAAGMGGGSADAAAALRLASAAAGLALTDGPVAGLAPGLGSDVPAALLARACLITGVGETVEPLPAPEPFGVLVLPSIHHLSTPAVYGEFDRLRAGRPPQELAELAGGVRAAVAEGAALPDELGVNDLQDAARSLCPAVDRAVVDARAAGADRAMVSGSGPTVVGWFYGPQGPRRARHAARELARRHPGAVAAEPVAFGFAAPRTA